MNENFDRERVLLIRLLEKTSKLGNKYFVGRLGAGKVVMVRDQDSLTPRGDPIWLVWLAPVDEKAVQASAKPHPEPVQRSGQRSRLGLRFDARSGT
jgi:hypothetical protein